MKEFKKIPKMKTGGSVKSEYCAGGKARSKYKEGGEVSHEDVVEDKKLIKKAFKMHDEQEHPGEKTDLSKLKKGGRAKKEAGTVKKFNGGGMVPGMGVSQASGPMGVTAPGEAFQPGRTPTARIGYKSGGKTKKGC